MGALLAQNDHYSLDDELGSTTADIALGITSPIALGISKLFGGGTRNCVEKEQKIKEAINQHLSYSDRRELVRGMDSSVSPTAAAMARFYVGGKDCKHKNVGRGDQRFLDRLPALITQRAQEAAEKEQSRLAEQARKEAEEQARWQAQITQQQTHSTATTTASGTQPPANNPPAPKDNTMTYVMVGGGVIATVVVLAAILN